MGWAGVAAHLVLLVPYASAGLVAPPWAVAGLLLVWAALLVLALVLLRGRRPVLALAAPLLAAAMWLLVLTAGDLLLGWTA
ncbi:hypothetical protein TH66_07085 [Carbonactinospora thermoautotrophica]|uniref:Uncharacterized protein n=1 Tax=Carbonactinospora thermoautotrophica TaxID=1469144 RepID=A0A132N3F6_9ACTN|nr:hypothetical protein TH66_07085 [Carbonactinospora thermoautotrophica]KWX10061.1 hypothetical protein TR74_05915 [Carbonactinospora thermoautotrophica]